MLINPSGYNFSGDHPAPRAEQLSGNNAAFMQDRVTIGGRTTNLSGKPTSATGSWDYNWRPDANPQEDDARRRRINDIRNEIANVEWKQREGQNRLQQIPNEIWRKENERSQLEYEKSRLQSERTGLVSEKNRMEGDRNVAKENDRYGYPPPPGAYGWGEVINGINDKLYPVLERIRAIDYAVRDLEYKMADRTREIDGLRTEQYRLNDEVSRTTWFIKERASEWKTIHSSMQNPTYDLACPYW